MKLAKKIVIVSAISTAIGFTVPSLWVTFINRSENDYPAAVVLIWLVYPGYKAAAFLFPHLANNESAGFTLLLPAMLITFMLYFLLTFVLCFLLMRVTRLIRGQ
jgi:hypothetical protein